jgi:hypothetical protein
MLTPSIGLLGESVQCVHLCDPHVHDTCANSADRNSARQQQALRFDANANVGCGGDSNDHISLTQRQSCAGELGELVGGIVKLNLPLFPPLFPFLVHFSMISIPISTLQLPLAFAELETLSSATSRLRKKNRKQKKKKTKNKK